MSAQRPQAGPSNRLISEKSPYLLQHAYNPVDWFPWGQEAFQKARVENKPIFLSIGYSTCHWCHVMERESFESPEIAKILNEFFVPIKVDREERPDIDQIYMSAIQMMTGSGGWPLTVFMTPEGKPFSGGTYFPPEDRWGRAGMKTLLPRLAEVWKTKREEIEKAGEEITGHLNAKAAKDNTQLIDEKVFAQAVKQFEAHFDPQDGGFGQAPKFPRSHELSFLLRHWKKTNHASSLAIVEKTLQAMAFGGMYDHLGGGFHRYSTDAKWLVPHFEKMLYDQAILAQTYSEAYLATKNSFYAEVAKDIFNYVLRDMTDSAGGFYSAEDADSEGEEGKFYVWTPEEIEKVLGAGDARLFCGIYNVTEGGNFEHQTSIIHLTESIADYAQRKNLSLAELNGKLQVMRDKLFEVRKKRIPPYKDDKVLTAWNGLMISALSRGGRALEETRLTAAAARCADFLLSTMKGKQGLLRRYREGEVAVTAFQEDYAFLALGLLDLYEATFEPRWLLEAKRLTDEMVTLFWDGQAGGFFYTRDDGEKLIARSKEYYDGAVPSGNSIAAMLLIRLARMTGDSNYEEKANKTIQSNSAGLLQYPSGFPELLMAYDFALGPSREVVITGDFSSAEFKAFKQMVNSRFYPKQVVVARSTGADDKLDALIPHLKVLKAEAGKTTGYVCQNFSCQQPVFNVKDFERVLGE